jgi:RNA polymerase sigma-70 factor, ECF subfamily
LLFRKQSSFDERDLGSVIAACRLGNTRAQQVLFKQFFGYAKSICLRYTSSTEEAEDVLSESFLKVFQRLDQYDGVHPFRAWLRSILINTALSYYRKYHKLDTEAGLDPNMTIPFNDDVVDRLTAEEILDLVQKLPPVQRTVFSLHVVDGYTLHEVAELMEMNEVTVRSHFYRSRLRLQQAIRVAYPHFFSTDPSIPIRYYEN